MKKKALMVFSCVFLISLTNCGGSDTNSAELKLETTSENSVKDNELIKLFNISRSSLGSEFVNNSEPERKPKFRIEGKQYYSIGSEKYLLAAMGITNPNELHMAFGSMNIGLFKYEGDRWNRIDLVKNVSIPSEFGEYGEIEKFELFGPKNICIGVSGHFMAQGIMDERQCIIGVVENKLKVIYSGEKSFNDEANFGNQDREIRISFKKTDSGFYELKEEKYSKKRLTKTNIKVFNEKKATYL
ncbi:MAG: hypothetical protein ACKO6A_08070 [Bacteroidota bacterium]